LLMADESCTHFIPNLAALFAFIYFWHTKVFITTLLKFIKGYSTY